MTVQELFESERVTKEDLEAISEESAYWENSLRFVEQNWERDITQLSHKQYKWATSICDDMILKRIEGRK